MFKHLTLVRPLAVIDLETTGTNTQTDRIVEISVLKVPPTGAREHRTRRVNPGIPIPPEARAVHGISDTDVAHEPGFRALAPGLLTFLNGCDLCGYNLKRFDLRMLYVEFQRAGLTFPLEGRAILDPLEIYHAKERRDLASAVRFYLGREHDGAHAAGADVLATAEVLDAMLARYDDLPRTAAGLQEHFKDPDAVDAEGRFTRVEGQVRFNFGRFRGQPLKVVARSDPGYLTWILKQDFSEDAKRLVSEVLKEVAPCG